MGIEVEGNISGSQRNTPWAKNVLHRIVKIIVLRIVWKLLSNAMDAIVVTLRYTLFTMESFPQKCAAKPGVIIPP